MERCARGKMRKYSFFLFLFSFSPESEVEWVLHCIQGNNREWFLSGVVVRTEGTRRRVGTRRRKNERGMWRNSLMFCDPSHLHLLYELTLFLPSLFLFSYLSHSFLFRSEKITLISILIILMIPWGISSGWTVSEGSQITFNTFSALQIFLFSYFVFFLFFFEPSHSSPFSSSSSLAISPFTVFFPFPTIGPSVGSTTEYLFLVSTQGRKSIPLHRKSRGNETEWRGEWDGMKRGTRRNQEGETQLERKMERKRCRKKKKTASIMSMSTFFHRKENILNENFWH